MTGPLPPLREVIARHGLLARKRLGQHFLFDLNLTARIARAAGDLSDMTVIEIGPGPGGLTRALLETGAREVVAIEKDARFLPALAELAAVSDNRLRVICADARTADLVALAPPPRAIVANLPYNLATTLIIAWLRQATQFRAIVVMVQKEVAQRLAASPGGSDYGRLAVVTGWLCEARLLFDVQARAFTPPPKVTSTVVALTPRQSPAFPAEFADLEAITQAAFGKRRKMLRGALAQVGGKELLAAAGIEETSRAEELTIEQFCALARAYRAWRLKNPGADA